MRDPGGGRARRHSILAALESRRRRRPTVPKPCYRQPRASKHRHPAPCVPSSPGPRGRRRSSRRGRAALLSSRAREKPFDLLCIRVSQLKDAEPGGRLTVLDLLTEDCPDRLRRNAAICEHFEHLLAERRRGAAAARDAVQFEDELGRPCVLELPLAVADLDPDVVFAGPARAGRDCPDA